MAIYHTGAIGSNTTDPNATDTTAVVSDGENGDGSNGVLSGIDEVLSTIESAFTNIVIPLQQDGIINSPSSQAAKAAEVASAQQAQAAQNAAIASQQQTDNTRQYLIYGGFALLALLLWKKYSK